MGARGLDEAGGLKTSWRLPAQSVQAFLSLQLLSGLTKHAWFSAGFTASRSMTRSRIDRFNHPYCVVRQLMQAVSGINQAIAIRNAPAIAEASVAVAGKNLEAAEKTGAAVVELLQEASQVGQKLDVRV